MAAKLTDLGYPLDAEDILPAQGWHRSSPYSQAWRWEAFGDLPSGLPFHIASFETLTALLTRKGFYLASDQDGPAHFYEAWSGASGDV
jgi:hypothetical protein